MSAVETLAMRQESEMEPDSENQRAVTLRIRELEKIISLIDARLDEIMPGLVESEYETAKDTDVTDNTVSYDPDANYTSQDLLDIRRRTEKELVKLKKTTKITGPQHLI